MRTTCIFLLLFGCFSACGDAGGGEDESDAGRFDSGVLDASDDTDARDPSQEVSLVAMPLSGPVAAASAEVSGLAWNGDTLVFLPERLVSSTNGQSVYTLSRADIYAFLDSDVPLSPTEVPIVEMLDYPVGFSPSGNDYEGLVFVGNETYLLNGDGRYFMAGTWSETQLTMDLSRATEVGTGPMTEGILSWEQSLVTFREFNGDSSGAEVRLFDFDLNFERTMPLTPLDYRITDVTEPDASGRFWAMNYRFPAEGGPWPDALATMYGQGETHAMHQHVERLVEFQISSAGVTRTETPPLQLELISDPRNWEGIVRLDDRGFLIVTDLFPQPNTTFAFIPL